MTQSQPATGASLQIKTVTQMTQMTQSHADILPWCMLALAATCCAMAGGRWHAPAWPLAIPTMLGGGWAGPSGKGQQKRTGCEQFFFLQNFYFLL